MRCKKLDNSATNAHGARATTVSSRVSLRKSHAVGVAALLTVFAPVTLAQQYSITDLGTLGGPTAGGYSINNFGQVVGISTLADANTHAFLWDGTINDIPPLAGDAEGHAFAISDSGLVVSTSYDLGDVIVHGYLWQNGSAVPLGDFAPRGVSNAGTVVGYSTSLDATYGWIDRAARHTGGVLLDMGTLGGHSSFAHAVTDDDRIVGMSFLADDSTRRAFLWQTGTFHDLGTLGGANSYAYDINAAGDVVGLSDTSAGASRAFLFATDASGAVNARYDLGDLGNGHSAAYAVNSQGDVVGTSSSKAFLWTGGTLHDLNTMIAPNPDWRLETAWDINDSGQIVGVGMYLGFPHAYLLSPQNCPDFNGDGQADLTDLAILLSHFDETGPSVPGDADGDGDVDLTDLAILLSAFDSTCL